MDSSKLKEIFLKEKEQKEKELDSICKRLDYINDTICTIEWYEKQEKKLEIEA